MEQLDPSMVQTRWPSQPQPSEASRKAPAVCSTSLWKRAKGSRLRAAQ